MPHDLGSLHRQTLVLFTLISSIKDDQRPQTSGLLPAAHKHKSTLKRVCAVSLYKVSGVQRLYSKELESLNRQLDSVCTLTSSSSRLQFHLEPF